VFVDPVSSFPSQKVYSSLLCSRLNFLRQIKSFDPSGKSLLIFGNHVKPKNKKYFASQF